MRIFSLVRRRVYCLHGGFGVQGDSRVRRNQISNFDSADSHVGWSDAVREKVAAALALKHDELTAHGRRVVVEQTIGIVSSYGGIVAEVCGGRERGGAMTKVSIVSSVFNREDHVIPSIESMLAQEYDDFEIVLIDDGSSDQTLERIKAFDDPRVVVISQKNTGFTIAIDRAVRAAKGDYIAIVDGGDICFPDRIREQAAFLDQNPDVGAVGSWVKLVEQRSNKVSIVKLEAGVDPATTLLKKSIFWHSEVMFRADLYAEVGGYRPEFYYSQDNDLWLRMSEKSRLATVPKVLQQIIKFDGGISTTPQKMAMARTYRDFAVYCATERRAGRRDPIAQFGRNALIIRPRSRALANRLAMDGLMCMLREDRVVGRWILNYALNEYLTFKSLGFWLVGNVPGVHLIRRAGLAMKRIFGGARVICTDVR